MNKLNNMYFEFTMWCDFGWREGITDFCLWIIQKVNPWKDRMLAQKLGNLMDNYNP